MTIVSKKMLSAYKSNTSTYGTHKLCRYCSLGSGQKKDSRPQISLLALSILIYLPLASTDWTKTMSMSSASCSAKTILFVEMGTALCWKERIGKILVISALDLQRGLSKLHFKQLSLRDLLYEGSRIFLHLYTNLYHATNLLHNSKHIYSYEKYSSTEIYCIVHTKH